MRLCRLTLHGFKTFADRTEVLVGPGLTAVVGPNGSGKSNLVDAIRWVVGEASARDLRGARAEQVIFAGGPGRGPVGMAEVSLTLEDADQRLPVEGAELALARRVYRDGASEFRQNGRRVRLRDLEHLLLATGLTQTGYAIVAQHDLDQVVQGSPAQRRQLIEVAAGVRYQQQVVQEAAQALAATAAAMEGAGGRLAEIEPRVAELGAEAEVAAEAERLHTRLRQLRGSLEREAWLRATAELQRLRRRHEAAGGRRRDAEAAVRDFAPTYRQGVAAIERIQAARPIAERQLGEARVEEERARGRGERWEDRCLELAGRHARELRAADAADRDRRDALQLADSPLDRTALDALEASRVQLKETEAEAAALAERLGPLEAGRREAADRLSAAAGCADQQRAAAAAAAAQETAAAAACEGRRRAADEAATLRERLTNGLPAVESETARAVAVLAAAAVALERAEAAEAAALAAVESAEADRRRALADQEGLEGERSALAAQLAAQDRGPIARAARAGQLALVALLEHVRPRLASDVAAVEAGLAEVAGALVGDPDVIARAAAGAGGAAELLCWDTGDPPPERAEPAAGCRPLAGALAPDPLTDAVVARLSAGVVLAVDAESAAAWLARHRSGRAVLPDGTVLGTGLRRTPAHEPGRIEHAGRLASATARAADARLATEAALAIAAQARRAHAEARAAVDTCREARAGAAASAAALGRSREGARRAAQAAERERQLTADALGRAEREREEAGRAAAAHRRAAADALAEAERARGALAESEAQLARYQAELTGARERAHAAAVAAARAEGAASVARARAAERGRRLETAEAVLATAGRALDEAEGEAARGLAELQAARAAAAAAARAVHAAEAGLRAVGETLADPLAELSALEGRRAALASAVAHADSELGELTAELEEAARAAAQLAPEQPGTGAGEEIEPERAAREIGRLERRLEALGPVNARAATQLEELLARTEGLRQAHADCEAALATCTRIAGTLRAHAEVQFERAFAAVAERFAVYVGDLFEGGRGDLERQPPDPGLAARALPPALAPPAGVQLSVAPRGKRASPLALLSGGERALTALAFILALQSVRPSPFYVFDEVDAALDDHRIGRFVALLGRLSADTQFLVVTHNHATMERADVLLGVTLAGDGSSRVLTVQLDDARAVGEPSLGPAARSTGVRPGQEADGGGA